MVQVAVPSINLHFFADIRGLECTLKVLKILELRVRWLPAAFSDSRQMRPSAARAEASAESKFKNVSEFVGSPDP